MKSTVIRTVRVSFGGFIVIWRHNNWDEIFVVCGAVICAV